MQIGSMQETGMTKTELENSLKEQFGDEVSVEDNEDGSFLVAIGENQYYVGEDGEIIDSSNMIEISTVEELKTFRDDVNNGNTYEGKYVYLTNDIILDSSEEWEPIGNRENPFKGIFNGKSNQIDRIYIDTNEGDQGLFGYSNNASIVNLGIGQNCSINGGNYTAGIIGTASNETRIIKCFNNASINCSGIASGGIAGQLTINGKISQCYNKGTVTGLDTHVGGICGNADQNSTIDKCYNSGLITGTTKYAGGIVGVLKNSILNNCYNIGSVYGHTSVGGICGEAMNSKSYIKNVYNIGYITGTNQVSGIAYCWNNSKVLNGFYLEGVVNGSNDTIMNEGILSISAEKLKESTNSLGNAFKEDTNNINSRYPILKWQ